MYYFECIFIIQITKILEHKYKIILFLLKLII